MYCLACGKEVVQSDAKRRKLYCNDACRMVYKRRQVKSEQPLPNKSITNINNEHLPRTVLRPTEEFGQDSYDVTQLEQLPPEVIDGKYNREYLPGGKFYGKGGKPQGQSAILSVQYDVIRQDTVEPGPVPDDLENCRYCGKSLPALEQPRKYPGVCCIRPQKEAG